MANYLSIELVSQLREMRKKGAGIRALSRQFGISTNTVTRYIITEDGAVCECGKPSGHQGWCKIRYARSVARQAFHAKRRGVILPVPEKIKISRVNHETKEKAVWVGIVEFNGNSLPAEEWDSAISQIHQDTKKVRYDVKEDVRQEMIVSCLEGRLPLQDIKRAVPTFINHAYRSGDYKGLDIRYSLREIQLGEI